MQKIANVSVVIPLDLNPGLFTRDWTRCETTTRVFQSQKSISVAFFTVYQYFLFFPWEARNQPHYAASGHVNHVFVFVHNDFNLRHLLIFSLFSVFSSTFLAFLPSPFFLLAFFSLLHLFFPRSFFIPFLFLSYPSYFLPVSARHLTISLHLCVIYGQAANIIRAASLALQIKIC